MRTRSTTISGKISGKIELLVFALVCIVSVLVTPVEVQAGTADNSLSSLTVEEGTLSPQFEGSRLNYTVAVSADTTSVTVNAKTVNPNAKILSGVGITTLSGSEDTNIRVLVEAENGNQATYTITVTRSGTPADNNIIDNPDDPGNGGDNGTTDTPEEPEQSFLPEGYSISEDFAAEDIPAGFQEAQVEYDGSTVRGASFVNGDLSLLYLTDANGAGEFYVMDILDVYPLIRVGTEESYIFLLHVPTYSSYYPGTPVQIPVGDQVFDEAFSTEADGVYLVYGMDQSGNEGFFHYDTATGTYTAQYEPEDTEDGGDTLDANGYLQKAYDDLNEKFTNRRDRDMKIIAALIVVIVILIFVIINLLLHGRRGGDAEEQEDIFEEKASRRGRRKKAPSGEDDTEALFYEEKADEEELSYGEKASAPEELTRGEQAASEKTTGGEAAADEEKAAPPAMSSEASMDALLQAVTASRQNSAALAAKRQAAAPQAEPEPAGAAPDSSEDETDVSEVKEHHWSDDDAFSDFEDDPELFGGRKAKKEKKKKEKRERKRRSGDIFDDVEEEEDIFGDRTAFSGGKPADEDDIEVMDLNDL